MSDSEPSSSDAEAATSHTPARSSPEALQDVDQEARVSYYVQVWDEMQHTVLERESYLFTPIELATLSRFHGLSYPARYLFIRLFVRRRGYFRLSALTKYGKDIPDLPAAVAELCSFASFAAEQRAQRDQTPPQRVVIVLDASPEQKCQPQASTSAAILEEQEYEDALGRFAEDETELAKRSDLDKLAAMASMEELKMLASQMQLSPPKIRKQGKTITVGWTRQTIVDAMRKHSSSQSTLFSFATGSNQRNLSLAFSFTGKKRSQSDFLVHKLWNLIGPVIKLDNAAIKVFQRLHLIFHRRAASPDQHTLTTALLARFEKRSYPTYPLSRQYTIFPDRPTFLAYEQAVVLEQRVEAALELSRSPCGGHRPSATSHGGTVKKSKETLEAEVEAWQKSRRGEKRRRWKAVEDLFETSWEWWVKSIEQEKATQPDVKDPTDPDDRRTYYLRRFKPGWVLTHCVFKTMDALAYTHQWDKEASVLRALLAQTFFCRGRRGKWWDRLALILMEHGLRGPQVDVKAEAVEDIESDDELVIVTNSKMSQLHCRQEALRICWQGLEDKWCHLVERHSLQRRIARLESMLKVPEDERHVFPAQLNTAQDITVEGEQLGDRITGKKAWWKSTLDEDQEDEQEGEQPGISVEELSLQHYRSQGWQGVHSENTILTMLFGLLFFDILFHPVEGAFETPYQAEPLDLRSDAFAIVRHELVWNRLAEIRDGQSADLIREVDERERPKGTWCVGVRWDAFSAEEIQQITRCIGDEALAVICQVYAEDYEHRAGGVPDLFLWKPRKSRCKFSEVKGPGDRISKTQKVWIDVLLSAGLQVDKCSVRDKRSLKRHRGAKEQAEAAAQRPRKRRS